MGSHDFLDNDGFPRLSEDNHSNAVAKIIFSKKSKHFENLQKIYPRFYIKLDPNSKIFNPKKILSSIEEKDSLSFINSICKTNWEFKEVTSQIFQKYITFLKTKNISWLKDAQRDLK
jgi:hypothetical protein